MNENLLHIVARANVDRIYGDGRFDWIDDTFTEAVIAAAKELRWIEHGNTADTPPAGGILDLVKKLRAGRA